MIRRLLAASALAALIASPAMATQVQIDPAYNTVKSAPQYGASGVAPSASTISSAAAGTAYSGYAPGRPVHLAFTPTAFTGTCVLEESLDGSGTNWWTETVGAAGSVVALNQWVFSATSAKTFSTLVETQAAVPLRLDCGVVNGSYSSGSLAATFYQ